MRFNLTIVHPASFIYKLTWHFIVLICIHHVYWFTCSLAGSVSPVSILMSSSSSKSPRIEKLWKQPSDQAFRRLENWNSLYYCARTASGGVKAERRFVVDVTTCYGEHTVRKIVNDKAETTLVRCLQGVWTQRKSDKMNCVKWFVLFRTATDHHVATSLAKSLEAIQLSLYSVIQLCLAVYYFVSHRFYYCCRIYSIRCTKHSFLSVQKMRYLLIPYPSHPFVFLMLCAGSIMRVKTLSVRIKINAFHNASTRRYEILPVESLFFNLYWEVKHDQEVNNVSQKNFVKEIKSEVVKICILV